MSDAVARLWRAYCAEAGVDPHSPVPPAGHFCDNEADADECADLVVAGRKRATASSLWGLQHRGERIPEAGDLEVVTTWDGTPRAVIRTTRVETQTFSAITAAFAATEGEGDGSLEWWRRVHREYYRRELAGTPFTPSEDMPVVCQYFEVVYRAPDNSRD